MLEQFRKATACITISPPKKREKKEKKEEERKNGGKKKERKKKKKKGTERSQFHKYPCNHRGKRLKDSLWTVEFAPYTHLSYLG